MELNLTGERSFEFFSSWTEMVFRFRHSLAASKDMHVEKYCQKMVTAVLLIRNTNEGHRKWNGERSKSAMGPLTACSAQSLAVMQGDFIAFLLAEHDFSFT